MHAVTLIPGEGIGPEVSQAARRIVDASGVKIDWQIAHAGGEVIEKYGSPLPKETLDSIRETKVALKGPVGTPSGGQGATKFRSVNVQLRKELDLYSNFRPAKSMPGVKSRYSDIDLIVIRENTEGLYSGLEHTVVPGVVESLRVITEKASERIAHFAFQTARQYSRKKVTCVHKANILQLSDGLFLSTVSRVAQEYRDIQFDNAIVDAAAMKLVLDPHKFDVLVMENLFGDILSDLTAGLVGGLGLTPSGNIGADCAVYEAVHGTAPDIAGKNLANPTALVLSAAMMLRRLNETAAADAIEAAIRGTISEGKTITGDLGGKASTTEFTEAVIARL
jgi:isocitrate dehydrogenase (NAD+)